MSLLNCCLRTEKTSENPNAKFNYPTDEASGSLGFPPSTSIAF